MENYRFQAGAAKVVTTPPMGSRINGDFVTHYANLIHDDLHAKAIVLQQGATYIALVVVDICVMPKDFLDEVKQAITEATGIPFDNILLSSTHTHAAGSLTDIHLGGVDLAYRKKLPALLVESVVKAKENLRPARIAFGSAQAPEHVLCRRYWMKEGYVPVNPVTGGIDQIKTNPFGGEDAILESVAQPDPQLSYLAIQGLDGKWIALLGNYSLHYVGDWENGTISADYFGVFGEKVKEELKAGDDFVGIMSNGTSGDINIWDFKNPDRYPREHFEKSKLIGSALAATVAGSMATVVWEDNPELDVRYEQVSLGIVKPTEEEVVAAKVVVGAADYRNIAMDMDGLKQIYAREQVLLSEFPDSVDCPVQVIRIGSGVIGALAGEFFAQTGLALKDVSQKPYFTISLANGNVGYVPPAEEIDRGGYETWRCRYSCYARESEKAVREKLISMIESL
jgi:neutral ceramidase